jgi:hypothetical protein
MKIIRQLRVILPAVAATLAIGASAAAQDPKAPAVPATSGTDLSETDMSHTSTSSEGTVTVPWTMLGGVVGNRTINGMDVGLYVLLAQEPDKLKPGDPNHAFTVTLKDAKSSALLKQGEVSIAVAGGGTPVKPAPMSAQSAGVFRLGVRLPQPGQYRIKVAFKAEGRSGQAEFPYTFSAAAQPPAHHH